MRQAQSLGCFGLTLWQGTDTGAEDCERCNRCVTVQVWKQLKDAIDGVVDRITLADLVNWDREQNGLAEDGEAAVSE